MVQTMKRDSWHEMPRVIDTCWFSTQRWKKIPSPTPSQLLDEDQKVKYNLVYCKLVSSVVVWVEIVKIRCGFDSLKIFASCVKTFLGITFVITLQILMEIMLNLMLEDFGVQTWPNQAIKVKTTTLKSDQKCKFYE